MTTKTKKRSAKKGPVAETVAAQVAPPVPTEKVLVLRSCWSDMTSSHGFTWPESGPVECPDWKPIAFCGNGLHGLLWAVGDYGLTHSHDAQAKWLVVEVDAAEVVDLGDKVKFPRGVVVFCGGLAAAMNQVLFDPRHPIQKAATTGDRSAAATTGYGSAAATTGYRSAAATTGDRSAAATTGYGSAAACLGVNGKARAGATGSIILTWYDEAADRRRHVVGYPGEDGVKPDTWYAVAGGRLVETDAPGPP
jgi:hypothetical protein